MAGGAGERFWPVSTKERPKQFLHLAQPETSLLQDSVSRAVSLAGPDDTYIATGRHLADVSLTECPNLPRANVLAEPSKRNTAGCLVWVAANLIAQDPDGWGETTVGILTADQRISTDEQFVRTCALAMSAAEQEGAIVTIGIPPDRPETGFGYIEVGEPVGDVHKVVRFREKPSLDLAKEFLAHGGFLWNSGMFFYTLPTFVRELTLAQPEMAAAMHKIAGHLARGESDAASAAFDALPSISFDFAVMEKADRVLTAKARFVWDDLGAWDAIARSYTPDAEGNVSLGSARHIDTSDTIVYNEVPGLEVCTLGIEGLIVVVTNGTVLVCDRERAQEVKRFLSE